MKILCHGKSYSKMYRTEPRYNDLWYNDNPDTMMWTWHTEHKIVPTRYNDIICFSKIALVIIWESKTKTEGCHCYNHLAVIIVRENKVLNQSACAIFDNYQCNFTKFIASKVLTQDINNKDLLNCSNWLFFNYMYSANNSLWSCMMICKF